MTESEALKYFKDANRTNDAVCVLQKSDIGKCIIKALEKQIPKKPDEITDRNFKEGKCFYCPSCGDSLATNEDDTDYNYWLKHCDNCGQAIDWSGENE